jgi:octaprenyl-diphosphate synthase
MAERVFDDELASKSTATHDLCDTLRAYRGKMLRPALLLLSGKACGTLTPAHRTLAAVVEMVHMDTLVHDDVLDEADERRRRPTIGAIVGNTAAVLLGDYLISHAFHLCSGLQNQYASRRIGSTTNTVCEGELLQNHHRGNDRLTEAQYIDIIERKTGALTAIACELGATFAGADESTVRALHAYGQSTGVAFQIIDDVLDLVGNRAEVGKTLGLDLSLGKLTLPTLHCLANTAGATAQALRAALHATKRINAAQVRDWLEETDSIEYAISVARGYVAEASRKLDVLPPTDAKQSLIALAEFILDRRC